MPAQDYRRYAILKNVDGTINSMPYISIPERPSDKYIFWNTSRNRLDRLSQKYYGNPFFDFLILYANPSYVSEFDISDGALIRIPFPLAQAKSDYESKLQEIKNQ